MTLRIVVVSLATLRARLRQLHRAFAQQGGHLRRQSARFSFSFGNRGAFALQLIRRAGDFGARSAGRIRNFHRVVDQTPAAVAFRLSPDSSAVRTICTILSRSTWPRCVSCSVTSLLCAVTAFRSDAKLPSALAHLIGDRVDRIQA